MTMIAPALAAVRTADESTDHARDLDLPNGDDLALSRGTDLYGLDELLTGPERELRDRVRVWCDTEVSPAAADYLGTGGIPRPAGQRVCRPWHRRCLYRRRRLSRPVLPCGC